MKLLLQRLPLSALASAMVLLAGIGPVFADTFEPERLEYRWQLGGLLGGFARLFLPGSGEGSLTTKEVSPEHREVELYITADAATDGEFWRYGSQIDVGTQRTLKAWSAYRFRGKDRSDESDLGQESVIDVASGIDYLRREQPRENRMLRIWSDGRVYPVVIEYRGVRNWRAGGGVQPAHFYAIRSRKVPGERLWKGSMDIYLDLTAEAVPLEISVERKFARMRLIHQ